MRRRLLVFAALCCGYAALAQKPMSIQIKDPVICYANSEDHLHYVAPPKEYLAKAKSSAPKLTNATVIEVTYIGFEGVPEAQAAFQKAVDIWSSILTTSVTIRIEARWVKLSAGVLGSANYTAAYANFKGAQRLNVFYPVALAEKITGRDLNDPTQPDIFANFNSDFNWHFDPDDANIPSGKYDLTTVVLHEIGHGLGFSGTFSVSAGQGSFGLATTDVPIVYDAFLQNGAEGNLIENFTSPSSTLNAQLTSSSLFFKAHSGTTKLYAPSTFDAGSSVSHVDETTFNNTPNALMTPQIAARERIHDPGIALDMLKDMGWEMVYINHFKLPDIENVNGPYTVTAGLDSDEGFDPAKVKLNYTLDGTNFTTVAMTAGGGNNFSANIAHPNPGNARTFGYYISAENETGSTYVNPGVFVRILNPQQQGIHTFSVGPDTEKPIITHSKQLYLLDTETELVVNAVISDNIGSLDAVLEYSINDVEQDDITMTLKDPGEDSVYTATISFSELSNGDEIKYRIVATDHSSNENQSISPKEDTYVVPIIGFEPAQASYQNNFSDAARDQEFFGEGYTITTPTLFDNRAIHSEHPYVTGDGFPNNERNIIYQLRIPVTVASTDAFIRFDEIALVEPGATGSVFGDDDFFDYVIVEGSKDQGETWEYLLPGYDARASSSWRSKFNSAIDADGNSTATGSPDLYKPRQINMLSTFDAGDEVLIRFRMYIDQLATGWGWAIDNLAIQSVITGTEAELQSGVYLYPNPTREKISVEAKGSTEFSIQLISMQGQKIYEATELPVNGKMVHTIAAHHLAAGMYLVKISNGSESVVRKIIKTN